MVAATKGAGSLEEAKKNLADNLENFANTQVFTSKSDEARTGNLRDVIENLRVTIVETGEKIAVLQNDIVNKVNASTEAQKKLGADTDESKKRLQAQEN